MKSQNEFQDIGAMPTSSTPKSGCRICKVVLIVAVILFISSVLLAAFTLGKSRMAGNQIDTSRALTADQHNERIQTLREFVRSHQASSTIIRAKTTP